MRWSGCTSRSKGVSLRGGNEAWVNIGSCTKYPNRWRARRRAPARGDGRSPHRAAPPESGRPNARSTAPRGACREAFWLLPIFLKTARTAVFNEKGRKLSGSLLPCARWVCTQTAGLLGCQYRSVWVTGNVPSPAATWDRAGPFHEAENNSCEGMRPSSTGSQRGEGCSDPKWQRRRNQSHGHAAGCQVAAKTSTQQSSAARVQGLAASDGGQWCSAVREGWGGQPGLGPWEYRGAGGGKAWREAPGSPGQCEGALPLVKSVRGCVVLS